MEISLLDLIILSTVSHLSLGIIQIFSLKELLINTGDAFLIEASPVDSYWGEGKYGTGKNRLGILLMKLRDELKEN